MILLQRRKENLELLQFAKLSEKQNIDDNQCHKYLDF